MSPSPQQDPAAQQPRAAGNSSYSPRAGCLLMLIIFGGFCVLVVIAWLQIFSSTKAVSAMCQPEPQQLPQATQDAAAKAALQQKTANFLQQLGSAEAGAELQLAADELNMLIAEAPQACGLKNSVHVKGIDQGVLQVDLALQLKAAPFSGSQFQYWNGSADLRPKYVAGRFKLFLENPQSRTGAQVPDGLVGMFNPWEPWSADEQLNANALWNKLSSVECREGVVLLRSRREELAALQQVEEQQPVSNTLRYVVIIGLGMLSFAVFGWLYQRRKKRLLQG